MFGIILDSNSHVYSIQEGTQPLRGSAVAANGRIMREGETTRIIRPLLTTVAFSGTPGCKEQSVCASCSRRFLRRMIFCEKPAAFRDHVRKYAPRGTRKSLFRHGLTNMRPQCRGIPNLETVSGCASELFDLYGSDRRSDFFKHDLDRSSFHSGRITLWRRAGRVHSGRTML